MTDNLQLQEQNEQVPVPRDEDNPQSPTTMSEPEQPQTQPNNNHPTTHSSFTIWPPTQRTRDAVTSRLIETLSTQSVLSKRYGTLPHDEASAVANRIEDAAFSSAASFASGDNDDDDGIEVLQVYSKEISRLMLDTVRSRSASDKPEESDGVDRTSEQIV